MKTITAKDGYVLTNGNLYCKTIYVSPQFEYQWTEITQEEAEKREREALESLER